MNDKPKGKKGATTEEIEKMRRMREAGAKIKQIAIKFGTDYDWTQAMLKKNVVLKEPDNTDMVYMKPEERQSFRKEWEFWTDLISGRRKLVKYGN